MSSFSSFLACILVGIFVVVVLIYYVIHTINRKQRNRGTVIRTNPLPSGIKSSLLVDLIFSHLRYFGDSYK